jgi:hypothetical protein
MHRSSFRLAALAVVVAFATIGCGGGPKVKPVTVEGVVLLDGQPLAGATVRYVPLDEKGQSANGLTKDDGTFRLTCLNGLDGALPGEYKVVITHAVGQEVEVPASPEEAQRLADKMMRGGVGKKKAGSRPKKQPSPIRPDYSDEAKTTLRATVPSSKATWKLESHKS